MTCCLCLMHFTVTVTWRQEAEALRSQATRQGPQKLPVERWDLNPGSTVAGMKAPGPPGGPGLWV